MLTVAFLLGGCGGGDGSAAEPGNTTPTTPTSPTTGEDEGTPDPAQPSKNNKMALFAHYMPWFASPTASGVWNHWTMSADALRADKSNLASHYEPLTGAYASDDEAVLDYQCLLMKYAGLDGLIIDYMGESGKNDFAFIAKSTKKMADAAKKAGLSVALCYDEQTALAEYVFPDASDAKAQGRTDMRAIKNNYFSRSNYLKHNGHPVLLMFGPARLKGAANWEYISQPLEDAEVVVLNGHASSYGSPAGEFLWVNPNPDYSGASAHSLYIAGAMPGFWDVYKEFNQGTGYTTYDRENGALFQRQLATAKDAGQQWLQVSTWNDYGEGTTIEPTVQYQYQYLTILQQFAGVGYGENELKLVKRWYDVRRSKGNTTTVAKAYSYLAALQTTKAEQLIAELEK